MVTGSGNCFGRLVSVSLVMNSFLYFGALYTDMISPGIQPRGYHPETLPNRHISGFLSLAYPYPGCLETRR